MDVKAPLGDTLRVMQAGHPHRRLLAFLALGAVLVASLGAVETLAQRRRRVEQMSAEQREELLHNEQEFHRLPEPERQRMRDLHEQIENDPDREQLRATMNRYCKWLETQPNPCKLKLLAVKQKPLSERIKTVKELLALDLDDKDRRVLAAWLDRDITERSARWIESGAPGSRPEIAKLPPERQKTLARERFLWEWQRSGPGRPVPPPPAMADLLKGLSQDLRAKLETKQPRERDQIIVDWLREIASREIEASRDLDEQLANFFESPAIEAKTRDWLMSLPSNEMYKNLNDLYRAYLGKSNPGGRAARPRGFRPGSRRGPEDREEIDARAGKGFREQQDRPVSESTAEKPPLENRGPEKSPAGKSAAEKLGDK